MKALRKLAGREDGFRQRLEDVFTREVVLPIVESRYPEWYEGFQALNLA